MSDMTEYFGEPISTYTRAQAIADGVLVDVSEDAREAGFTWPVALTRAVWGLIEEIPKGRVCESVKGRLWDVLWMGRLAAHRGGTDTLYSLILHQPHRKNKAVLKLHGGPGDNGEPVITIMLPNED